MKRKTKPTERFTGITLEQWQSDIENIRWAQLEPRFRSLISVVLNECHNAHAHPSLTGCSEARAFGRVEGYHMALDVLRDMCSRPRKPEQAIEATHDEPMERSFVDKEPLD